MPPAFGRFVQKTDIVHFGDSVPLGRKKNDKVDAMLA
jgi:hypothetical protein